MEKLTFDKGTLYEMRGGEELKIADNVSISIKLGPSAEEPETPKAPTMTYTHPMVYYEERIRIDYADRPHEAAGMKYKWGGRIAVEENGPRIFWYGIGYTMSEIMMDLPAANFNIN